jgi:hypothetical protein
MLIAPVTATYSFRIDGQGSGRLVVEVDGESIGEISSLEQSVNSALSARLSKGAHAVRVIMVGSALELDRIEVSAEGTRAD